MPQTGFGPPAQSDTSYEADALPPSHHGWINFKVCWIIFIEKHLLVSRSIDPVNYEKTYEKIDKNFLVPVKCLISLRICKLKFKLSPW